MLTSPAIRRTSTCSPSPVTDTIQRNILHKLKVPFGLNVINKHNPNPNL